MQFTVSFSLDNSAFDQEPEGRNPQAVAWVLRMLANTLDDRGGLQPEDVGVLIDNNGNTIGSWQVRGDSPRTKGRK